MQHLILRFHQDNLFNFQQDKEISLHLIQIRSSLLQYQWWNCFPEGARGHNVKLTTQPHLKCAEPYFYVPNMPPRNGAKAQGLIYLIFKIFLHLVF
jgi:hypothetical protein